MQIFCFIKPADLDATFENALLSGIPEELTKFSSPLERAVSEIKDWATNNSGSCICAFGEQLCLALQMDKLPDFSKFIVKYESTVKQKFAVGIGMNPLEAFKAMLASESTVGEQMVIYSPDIEEASYSELEKGELIKDENFSLDFPNLELEKDAPPEVASPTPEEQETKQKIVSALMMVRDSAKDIAGLKETSPKAFSAVKAVIDALLNMAQNVKKSEEDIDVEESSSEESSETKKKKKEELEKAGLPMPDSTPKHFEGKYPVGAVAHGDKVKVEARDEETRKVTGQHWHNVQSGMALGPTGHVASGKMPNRD